MLNCVSTVFLDIELLVSAVCKGLHENRIRFIGAGSTT